LLLPSAAHRCSHPELHAAVLTAGHRTPPSLAVARPRRWPLLPPSAERRCSHPKPHVASRHTPSLATAPALSRAPLLLPRLHTPIVGRCSRPQSRAAAPVATCPNRWTLRAPSLAAVGHRHIWIYLPQCGCNPEGEGRHTTWGRGTGVHAAHDHRSSNQI
jgi:hypothetical protein